MKEEVFIEIVRDLKQIFDKAGITFWLDWGGLLGIVRSGKLIPWDIDIDLGVMEKDCDKIMSTATECRKKGIFINETSIPVPNTEFLYKRFSFCRFRHGVDITVYYTKGENSVAPLYASDRDPGNLISRILIPILWLLWCSLVSVEINPEPKWKLVIVRSIQYFSSLLPKAFKRYLIKKVKKSLLKRSNHLIQQLIVVPKHYFETLDTIEFQGMTINTPHNVKDYLKYKYGENWKIPNRKWDYRNDNAIKPISYL